MIYGHNDVGPVPDTPEPPGGHPAKHDTCKSLLDMDNNFAVVVLPDKVLEDPDCEDPSPPVVRQLITLEEDIPASLYMEEDVTVPIKCWSKWKFLVQKLFLGPKKFWVQKNFGLKKVLEQKKSIWVQKSFWGQKKVFGSKKVFKSKKILGPTNFGFKKFMFKKVDPKNVGSQKY